MTAAMSATAAVTAAAADACVRSTVTAMSEMRAVGGWSAGEGVAGGEVVGDGRREGGREPLKSKKRAGRESCATAVGERCGRNAVAKRKRTNSLTMSGTVDARIKSGESDDKTGRSA